MIDLTEAAIVRRIFEAFDRGASPREIAEGLNSDGEQAPYDGRGYQKLAGRGWPHTTVRSVLRNERYIGRVTWNRRQWNRSGDRKRRLSRLRPADDWVTAERSELVIIGPELWTRVQARLAERSRMTGVPKRRKGYFTSALSGLLRCGTCGSRMSLYGAVQKAGKTYRNFACSANREKGSEICPNSQQISEKKALGALVATVRGSLAHPKFWERFEATFRRLFLAARAQETTGEADALASELRTLCAVPQGARPKSLAESVACSQCSARERPPHHVGASRGERACHEPAHLEVPCPHVIGVCLLASETRARNHTSHVASQTLIVSLRVGIHIAKTRAPSGLSVQPGCSCSCSTPAQTS